LGGLLTSPPRMERATVPLRWYQMLGIHRMFSAPAVRQVMPRRLRDLQAMLPPVPRRPLRQVLPEVTQAAGQVRLKVGFFLGCVQSLIFAEQSAATVRVLARNGCQVITPREVLCCGMPSVAYGRPDLARQQARHNIRLFESMPADVVVTDCATCGSMLKGYSALLADDPDWTERAERFSNKVRDISEFLIALPLDRPRGRLEARVTYHDPCHLRRGQGVWRQPRELLNLIAGLEFVELPEADWCCGSAGSQLITHYKTSVQVLDRKMANLESTGAQVVASGCPGCRMQLNTGLERSDLSMQVVHPIELLDRAYKQ
jgi:glycolate dehydrogenase iron-sulfur subunit